MVHRYFGSKLYVLHLAQILYLCVIIQLHFIYFEVFQLEALMCYLIPSLLDKYTFRYQFITLMML
jgi:hypothetical protein